MASMAKGNSIPLSARLARWRVWVQGAFLLFWLDPLAVRLHMVCSPVFHCYSCPLALFACPMCFSWKARVREITGHNRGVSFAQRCVELRRYFQSWVEYVRLVPIKT